MNQEATDTKCYAIVSGWYSDRSFGPVFESRDDAIAYAAARNGIAVEDQERWQELYRSKYSTAGQKEMTEIEARMVGHQDHRVNEEDFYPAGVVPVLAAAAPEGEN